ncbi:MAG: type I polyketide synthase, partial [Pseudomonadota bacterium]
VYIGASASDHAWRTLGDLSAVDAPFMTGNTLSIVSNRISYLLDLRGPSFTVDTACSSSFYAMHQAVQALRTGEIDTAIVGGVNALLHPASFVGFSRATMLSPNGLCHAFDHRADGYVRSEGAIAFVLRRMDVAEAHGDPVRSVVLGSGINSDGRTVGMAMPSAERQADLLRQMLRELQFDPDDLAFLEAHGTGTPVGDPMEAGAIGEVFGRLRATPLPIGSAKTNFGHLEPASGLVGLLKAQMSLEKGVYPASLHVEQLNPNIPFDDLNLEVATDPVSLETRDAPWLAGVNSFGFGGANAHVILRQPYDTERTPEATPDAPRALVLSAASSESLRDLADTWRSRLSAESAEEGARLINAAAHRRPRHGERLVALGGSPKEISDALKSHLDDAGAAGVVTGKKSGKGEKVAFVFGGNGSQYAGMGLSLYESDPVFRAAFDEVSELFAKQSDIDLAEQLLSEDLGDALAESSIAQPILFAVQVAIVEALAAKGLRADAVAGHSVGEVAAAWCAGILTLSDAVHLIRTRSTALEVMKGTGGMAAVLSGRDAAEAALAEFGECHINIAGDNSPRSSTIAGPVEELKAFAKFARKRRVAAKLLDIDYPYHSAGVEPIRNQLISDLEGLEPRPGHAMYASSTTGRIAQGVALDTEYWWRNARQPVQFREAVEALADNGVGVFIEIGPRPVLKTYVSDTLDAMGVGAGVLQTLEQNARIDPTAELLAARALAHGAQLEDDTFFGPAKPFTGGLPAYPWRNSEFRLEPTSDYVDLLGVRNVQSLAGGRLREGEGAWRATLDIETHPWLKDHVVDGAVVFPAAGYLEMAMAAGCELFGLAELSEFEILRPIVLEKGGAVDTRVSVDQSTGAIRIESRRRLSTGEWGLNAFGVLRKTPVEKPGYVAQPIKGAKKISAKSLYDMLDGFGLAYGPAFRRAKTIRANGVVAEAGFGPMAKDAGPFRLDPTAFDAAMHAIFPLIGGNATGVEIPEGVTFLPVRVGRLRLYAAGSDVARARVRLKKLSPRGAEAEMDLLDEDGSLVAAVSGLRLKAVTYARSAKSALYWRQRLTPLANADHSVEAPSDWDDPMARAKALGVAADEAPEPDVGF